MRFFEKKINGLISIELDAFEDQRGTFSRIFCSQTFAENGLPTQFEQMNLSTNKKAGTLRGLHYQLPPYEEGKLIRCQKGSVYDVAIDMRPSSPTFLTVQGVTLRADLGNMVYVPPGCAHSFMTLEDATEVVYAASCSYQPHSERGIRYSDPFFTIDWPLQPSVISEKDKEWPNFDILKHKGEWEAGL